MRTVSPGGLKRIAFSSRFDQTNSRSSGSARMANGAVGCEVDLDATLLRYRLQPLDRQLGK